MRSHQPYSGGLRWLVAGGGLLALLIAIDAFVAFLFVVLSPLVRSGPPNPYVGIAYVLLPIVVVAGLLAAWAASRFWLRTSPGAERQVGAAAR